MCMYSNYSRSSVDDPDFLPFKRGILSYDRIITWLPPTTKEKKNEICFINFGLNSDFDPSTIVKILDLVLYFNLIFDPFIFIILLAATRPVH